MTARLVGLVSGGSRRILVVAGVLFVIAVVFGLPITTTLGNSGKDFQDPGSQYERTNAAIGAATGQSPFFEVVALLQGARRIFSNPAAQRAVVALAALLSAQHGFQRVLDYPASRSPALLSRDGRGTVVLAAFATPADTTTAISHVRASLSSPLLKATLAGMRVRFGGVALVHKELNDRTINNLARAELIALPILLLLSFWVFRGLVAALLPSLVGGLAILLTFLALRLIDQFTPISVFALNLVSGMGLGLGIDYSLFILYRYREELAGGATPHGAIGRTLQTAGRTVLFSCLTVAAALTCLFVFPIRFLFSMGLGGAIVTICDGAVALLVLPCVLIMLGPRIDALSPAWLQRRAARTATAHEGGGWWRLARGVMRHPGSVALLSAAILLAAAIPALNLRFISQGANLLPASAEGHEVEAALAKRFSANPAEAVEIVLRAPHALAQRLAAAATSTAGAMASASSLRYLGRGTWEIDLMPRGSPFSGAQQRLLARLRTVAGRYDALVGGATAYFVDQKAAIAAHVPLALLILVLFTGGFLFLMTGSLTIPVKALAMNTLSVSASAGLLVLIFQDGNLSSLLGFKPIGGLEESSLVLMFVLAFALATDYEVFVLSRIKEAHDQGLPNRPAIALGIERTGRIVTAAALLFCVAIGALATSELFFTKQLGLGTALAVAIDATIVRALLVPALMALMGKWNWWAPEPLRRLHKRFGLQERWAR
ncbi:MAG TPA: MMPL family transporter [Solirubrobacteraceae bacterium]|jgi:uncharacterized membrane protein YdfJ with MMPL/SSD domain|nr:MMPL family transporter [Solirubrobacteraceae bacterium]